MNYYTFTTNQIVRYYDGELMNFYKTKAYNHCEAMDKFKKKYSGGIKWKLTQYYDKKLVYRSGNTILFVDCVGLNSSGLKSYKTF